MRKNKGLYIHIPFCDEICPYCAFAHVLASLNKQDLYIDRLVNDLNLYHNEFFSSIYIGGGTPSSLSLKQLDKLLSALDYFIKKNVSFTIEANPSSLDEDKIKLFSKHHVNRISLGIETFDLSLQNVLNRHSSYLDIKELIRLIKKYRIDDINVDLMYGIPQESNETLKKDLELMCSLDITHISCYCLQVEEHTLFFNQKIKEMDEDNAADQYEIICKYLKEKGFIHYEISNFAKENYQSKHNLLYWRNEEYVGLGISSAGYENKIRYTNENSLSHYLNNTLKREEEIITPELDELYYIILHLRLKEGIVLKDYKKKFHKDFLVEYETQIKKLNELNYLECNTESISVKEQYFFILNTILLEFM